MIVRCDRSDTLEKNGFRFIAVHGELLASLQRLELAGMDPGWRIALGPEQSKICLIADFVPLLHGGSPFDLMLALGGISPAKQAKACINNVTTTLRATLSSNTHERR